uniref:Uncharacterized protein n=1 Tax=candidate division CPR3 bacterium TaxID=2268181 RepID=A0A7V3N571_UNCC3
MKNIVLKIIAFGFLISGLLVGILIIASVVLITFLVPEVNFLKLFFLGFFIFLFGCLVMLAGFGLFEFFQSLIVVEEKLEKIEEDVEEIKEVEEKNK